jgi:hypothetical protein
MSEHLGEGASEQSSTLSVTAGSLLRKHAAISCCEIATATATRMAVEMVRR